MWHTYEGHFWGMHWLWWITWIILIVLVFAVPRNTKRQTPSKDTPLDILKKRFARGEISREEYEEKKKVLQEDGKVS